MFKKYLIYVVLVAGLIMTGCGGGGGGSNSNPPADKISFHINPGEGATKAIDGTTTIVIPVNAFPQGADVIISPSQVTPTNKSIRLLTQPFSISLSSSPQADLTIRISNTRSRAISPKVINVLAWEATKAGWNCVEMKTISTLDAIEGAIDKVVFGTTNAYNFVAAELTVVSIVETQGLIMLAGTGSLGPGSLITIHGFNDTAESLRPLAQVLVGLGMYKNVYGLAYDWRKDAKPVSEYLGTIIDSVSAPKSIDVLAHSRGALVARYTFEVLGKTNPVKNFISVCGANQGTYLASTEALLRLLWSDHLNRPESGLNSPFGLAAFDTPALAELKPYSSFLSELNQARWQRGNINYIFIGGDHDLVVGLSSGLASNLQLEAYTSGLVIRNAIDADHSELVKTEAGINILTGLLKALPSGSVRIECTEEPVETSVGWDYTVTVNNTGSGTIYCEDMSIEEYNRYGDLSAVQWYPSGGSPGAFFPESYTYWGEIITGGSVSNMLVSNTYDWNRNPRYLTDPINWAKTVVYRLRYSDSSGNKYITSNSFVLTSGGVVPSNAKTRAPKPTTLKKGTTYRTK